MHTNLPSFKTHSLYFRAVFAGGRLVLLVTFAMFCMSAHAQEETRERIEGPPVYRTLLPLAYAGDPAVQTTLGLLRIDGTQIKRDLKVARQWLSRAAKQQYAPAQFYLGRLLTLDVLGASTTQELDQQLKEGLNWLRESGEQNYNEAQLLYAQLILLSQKEAPYGHTKPEAQKILLACINQDFEPCVRFALKKLDAGEFVFDSDNSIEQAKLEKKLLLALAQRQDTQAMLRLSTLPDETPMYWIRRAARLGEPAANLILAEQVLQAQVELEADDAPLLVLLQTAAQSGFAHAMYLLGKLLVEGTRFPANPDSGIQWLEMAAQAGHEAAQAFLDELATHDSNYTLESTP